MDLKEEANPKAYFIGYDIFGYFLPGALLIGTLTAGNALTRSVASGVWNEGHWADFVALALAAYLLGHAVAAVSSFMLEKLLLRNWLDYPTTHLFKAVESPSPLWRLWFLVPSYTRPYSQAFQTHFDQAFKSEFKLSPEDAHDRFWLCWSFNSLHHPAAYSRGTHFLNLYGYARNIAMALFLTMLVPVLPGWTRPMPTQAWVIASFVSGYVMFLSYTKLLRRLNDETYRGFFVISRAKHRSKEVT